MSKKEEKALSPDELEKLDQLLSEVRKLNYLSYILAGVSLAISTDQTISQIDIPIVELTLPIIESSVILYIIVFVLSFATMRLYRMAEPWISKDPRRPPFTWFGLRIPKFILFPSSFWIFLPIIICALSFTTTLNRVTLPTSTNILLLVGPISAGYIFFASYVLMTLSNDSQKYPKLIRMKKDERGGKATFPIYLLYWLRFLKISLELFFHITLTIICSTMEHKRYFLLVENIPSHFCLPRTYKISWYP